MSKKGGQAAAAAVSTFVKLLVPAGKASAQPPVGPALGAKGVKAMDFAKEFNAKTAHLEVGLPTPAIVKINPDRTFSFEIKSKLRPPTCTILDLHNSTDEQFDIALIQQRHQPRYCSSALLASRRVRARQGRRWQAQSP